MWLKKHWPLGLLFLILIIATILRFYKIEDLFIFGFDEEHQTSMAMTIVKNFHIIWIGVSASNLDFYLGPFWVYFTSFWLYLSKGNPLITGYVASVIGVITTFTIFWIGRRLFNTKVGLLVSLIYATLPLMVFSDRKFLTPSLVPLLSLVMFISLYQLKHSGRWLLVFAVAYGLVFHIHLSLAFFSIPAVYWLIKYRKKISRQLFLAGLALFILIISPLIAFDYFHKWSNITVPLRIARNLNQGNFYQSLRQHGVTTFEALGRIWYLKPNPVITDEIPFDCQVILSAGMKGVSNLSVNKISERTKPALFLSIGSLLLLVWFLLRSATWQDSRTKLLAMSMLSILVPFLLFPGGSLEYYLLGFLPLFLFLPAILMESQKGLSKYILMVMIIFSLLGIQSVLSASEKYSFKNKRELVRETMQVIKDDSFELSEVGVCHKYEGWRYLYAAYGRKPDKSSTDASLGWLYPDEISMREIRYKVLMSETDVPVQEDVKDAVKIVRDGFTAYIFRQ